MRSKRVGLFVLIILGAFGCGDDGGGNPSDAGNSGVDGAPLADAGSAIDGAVADAAVNDAGVSDASAADAASLVPVNGCTRATATDMTGMATVGLAWSLPHAACTIVSAGTTVTWTGDFSLHPLTGGVTPTVDPSSAISMATPSGNELAVTFASAGTFPYFCTVHNAGMQGVIYVE